MTITCPHCWESIEIEDLSSSPGQTVELTADCEVCCRPIRVVARWDGDDDEPALHVEPES